MAKRQRTESWDDTFRITIKDLGWGVGIYVTGLWYGGPLIQRFVCAENREGSDGRGNDRAREKHPEI